MLIESKSLENTISHMENHEAEIMAEVAGGKLSAFREIVERYQKPLLNYIYRYTGDRPSAEDIAQEVFLRVFMAAKEYRPQAAFKTWLFKIATNLCLNDLRDNKLRPNTVDLFSEAGFVALAPESCCPEKTMENRELSFTLKAALKSLPEKQRVALLLHKYSGFSYLEISRMMGCSISSVESLIHRARQSLRKQLNAYL